MEVHVTNRDIYIPTQFICQEGGIKELQEEDTLPAEARVRRPGDRKV